MDSEHEQGRAGDIPRVHLTGMLGVAFWGPILAFLETWSLAGGDEPALQHCFG